MATNKKSVGSIFNNAGFFRLRDANRDSEGGPGKASDIEMNPMGAQAATSGTAQTHGAIPPPATQRNARSLPAWIKDLPAWLRNAPFFTLVLATSLIITAVSLNFPYFPKTSGPQFKIKSQWTREGSDKTLTPKQVILAGVPRRFMWARFLWFLFIQVWILEAMYWYGIWATSSTGNKAKYLRRFKNLFFTVAVVVLALLMWGWLIWFI